MNASNPPELRECPFCGGAPEVERAGTMRQSRIVACTNCGCRVESGDVDGMTAPEHMAWNHRSAPASAEGWKGIESAPKTGLVLLLGYWNCVGKWRTVRGEWMSQAQIDEEWEESVEDAEGWYETSDNADTTPNCWLIEPTHWMPTPASPPPPSADGVEG